MGSPPGTSVDAGLTEEQRATLRALEATTVSRVLKWAAGVEERARLTYRAPAELLATEQERDLYVAALAILLFFKGAGTVEGQGPKN